MDRYKVDFHIHTTCSDGQASPVELVKRAKELGYDMIAITDHDGTEGVKEALIAGEAVGLQVVAGIEIATQTEEGIGLHILGYHIDVDNPRLKSVLAMLRERREERNRRLFQVLNDMGYEISLNDPEIRQSNGFIGKPVIARALVARGYIQDYKEAFREGQFFGTKEAKAIKKEKLQTEEAIRLIGEAGGIAVLAHPIQTRGVGTPGSEEFYQNMETLVRRLKTQGLKGMECYHPDQNHEQSMRFVEMAEKYHLHITRGSDFHGKDFADAEPTA